MNPYPHERTWSDCEAEIKQYLERLLWHDKLLLEKNDEIERLRGELNALQTHFDIKAKLDAEKDAEIERLCQRLRNDEKGMI